MNIPNSLTFLRIGLIPVFVLVFYAPLDWGRQLACLIFVAAALTDLLDGYLARKLRQTSQLGAFLDPVADKLMIAVVLVLLVERDPSPLLSLPAAVIIGREISVSALRDPAGGLRGLALDPGDPGRGAPVRHHRPQETAGPPAEEVHSGRYRGHRRETPAGPGALLRRLAGGGPGGCGRSCQSPWNKPQFGPENLRLISFRMRQVEGGNQAP